MKRFSTLLLLLFSLTAIGQETGDHYYAVKNGFEYGYEVKDSNELFLITYLGKKGNAHQFMNKSGSYRTVFQAEEGSEYATVYEYWKLQAENKTMLKLAPNLIAGQIFLDAWNNRLEQFEGEKGTLWVDGENGPVWSKQ